jgi:hypothetical protein
VLLGGGHWVRSTSGARLSVVVDERWRADALAAEFATRGVGCPDAVVDAHMGFAARSRFAAELRPRAAAWARGADESPPAQFTLSPGGLRLWAITAGGPDGTGYVLATAAADSATHRAAGAQLSRLGLPAVSLTQRRAAGWRVTSARRIHRLAEVLGDPPPGGAHRWPAVR